jgi:tRNA (mo5U34)-methyltransferase
MIELEDLRLRVATIPFWFHSIDLGQGVVTPGRSSLEYLNSVAETIFSRVDVTRKDVVDVGTWDGFYAFEAERRGAGYVLATDHYQWSGLGIGSSWAFLLAQEARESSVRRWIADPEDLPFPHDTRFDVVLCLGVLYHVDDPIGLLDRVTQVARGIGSRLVIETLVDPSPNAPGLSPVRDERVHGCCPSIPWVEERLRKLSWLVETLKAPLAEDDRRIFICSR